MLCLPRAETMNQVLTQPIATDQLGLADLLEISDLLIRRQTFRFRVASWSMYPMLRKGDRLTVEPVSATSLQVGDVILYHNCGQLICHRVVALDTAGAGIRIITRGDAAVAYDAPLLPDQVLGRVVGVRSSWHPLGNLTMRIDPLRTRLIQSVAQGLLALQGLRFYRRVMRPLLSHCFAYYVGIPEGRRWFRYHRIGGRGIPERLKGQQRFHLVAKLARISVGSLNIEAGPEGCRVTAFYVRIPYRGLGMASQLLAFACHLASRSGAGRLLATVEAENSVTLSLFDKIGFRPLTGLEPDGTAVLCRDLPR